MAGGNDGSNDDELSINAHQHEKILFTDDHLPGASGKVPMEIAKLSAAAQKAAAKTLHSFLVNQSSILLEFNGDPTPYTFVIHIPGSSKLKVCYGLGLGSGTIGQTSPLNGNFLSLTGDGGGEHGVPMPFVFPTSARQLHTVGTMTHTQFSTALTAKGDEYGWPLLPNAQVNTETSIMKLAPIPAFIVYDGFESDIDAAIVYERVLMQDTDGAEVMYTHLRHFLRSCLQTHNKTAHNPSIPLENFAATPSTAARQWAKSKFSQMFPTLTEATLPPQQETITAALLRDLIQLRQPQAPAPATATADKKDEETLLNMSQKEQQQLCKMCGLSLDAQIDDLPAWVVDCAAKNTTDTFRMQILRKQIMKSTFYDDADVPLTNTLLKMAVKRAWVGKDGNINKPSFVNAMDGLSPFVCASLDEDEVARINTQAEMIDSATSVTVQDLAKVKKALKASVPEEASDFLDMIKAFANLIFALFTANCPLFRAIKTIVDALKSFSKEARKALNTSSKASILWIILLQSRRFASGDMSLLCEFTTLQQDLCGKKSIIHHAEVPEELIAVQQQSNKIPKNMEKTQDSTQDDGVKRQRRSNPNTWHPKLKAVISGPMASAGNPNFPKIAQYCGFKLEDLFTNNTKICTSNMFFGRCHKKDQCQRSHQLPTEAEVEKIMALLDKLLKNPAGIRG